MALAHIVFFTAFLLSQGSSTPTSDAGQGKKTLKGLEVIPVPKLQERLLVEPCFIPRNPRSGLAWFTARKTQGLNAGGKYGTLGFNMGALQLEDGTEFALPSGYEKIIARRQPRALRMPWIGERKDWTLSVGRLPLAPLFLPPHNLSMLQRFPIDLQASDCPYVSDLDRDGIPELWFLPNTDNKGVGSNRQFPTLFTAVGSADPKPEKLDEDWLEELSNCHSVRFWDLDEDQYEEFIAMRGKEIALTFKNSSNLQLDKLPKESGLLDKSNTPIKQDKLCLGPKRRDQQWALAYGAEGQPPLLLHRKGVELAFHESGHFSPELSKLHILDARIFDFDGDAKEELLLLAQAYPALAPTTRSSDIQVPLRSLSRLTGVLPELLIYKLGKSEPTLPVLMDRGLYIQGATGLRVGDLDGDASPDLVVTRGLETPRFYRNVMFNPVSARFYRLALRGPEDWRHTIGSYIDLYDTDSEERLARFRWPPLHAEDQPLLWLTFELDQDSDLAGILVNWADGQAFPLEDLVRGEYRFEKR